MKLLLDLFLTFARVGVLTFGGGMAMIPMLQREIVEKKHWAGESDIIDYYAIAQCTPGVIAVNTATFVGQKQKGIAGGIAATLGLVFPSIVIISILAGVIRNISGIRMVQDALSGIQVCVCVLMINSLLTILKKSITDSTGAVIFVVTSVLSLLLNLSPVVFVVSAGIAGYLIEYCRGRNACRP